MRRLTLLVLTSVLAAPVHGQDRPRFTAERSLEVANWAIRDLSDDGAWLAATSLARRALIGVDHRHDMDPTYLRPAGVSVWVIDVASGDRRPVFAEPRNVRAVAWSPDGRTLALVAQEGETMALALWDRGSNRVTWAKLPADRYVAENSDLGWSRDGNRVLFNLRSRGWRERVSKRFAEMTEGPVFVQSSKEPFLAWDDLRREGAIRSVVSYDRRSGRIEELLPESRITSWRLAEDDSTIVWQEDITPKTDYDVIFGTETKLVSRSGRRAEPLTVLGSTKGLDLVWSRDGLRYAYAKDGKLFAGAVTDTARRQLAGPKGETKAPEDTSKAARDARARERLTPVRWSPGGGELIASNSQGLWIVDGASASCSSTPPTRSSLRAIEWRRGAKTASRSTSRSPRGVGGSAGSPATIAEGSGSKSWSRTVAATTT